MSSRFATLQTRLITLFLIALTSLSGSTSAAQVDSCSVLFEPSVPYKSEEEGDYQMRQAVELRNYLRQFKLNGQALDYPEKFQNGLLILERHLRESLEAYGFKTRAYDISMTVRHGERTRDFESAIFEIYGTPTHVALSAGQMRSVQSSPEALQLHALQAGARHRRYGLRFVVDPFFTLETGRAGEASGSLIRVDIDSFVSRRHRMAFIIRHEVQHFLEGVKILRGEPTLARLRLSGGEPQSASSGSPLQDGFSGLYSKNFRADEGEAFLRELRLGLEPNREADVRVALKLFRDRTREAIDLAESQMNQPNFFDFVFRRKPYLLEGLKAKFNMPPEFQYRHLTIDLTALISANDRVGRKTSPAEIDAEIHKVLSWSKSRIRELR